MNFSALFAVCVLIWAPPVFGSVLAFGAYFALLAGIGPARSAYVGVMSTVVALFVSSIFEAYDWRWATVFGIALAILGNVLALNVKPAVPSTKPVV
jgi:drug/metabolite transporter (DMT)-like permease